MPNKLTAAQIRAYERDGYVAPIDVISASQARALRLRLEAAERQYPERFGALNRNNAH